MAETRNVGFDEDEVVRRAFAAHFRAGGIDQPNARDSGVEEHGGKFYVVLRGGPTGLLRVYRVLRGGKLKGMRRWPKTIETRLSY